MSHLKISNVKIAGITSCVPKMIEENKELSFFKKGEAEKVIASTGIERRRIRDPNSGLYITLKCLYYARTFRPKNGMLYIRYILWLSGLGLWNECCCFSFIIWVYEEGFVAGW